MSEIDVLRQIVDDLAARVTAIESGLFVENVELRRQGFTPFEATFLALILKREFVSRDATMLVLYGSAVDDVPDARILDQFMLRIRGKLLVRGLPTPMTRQRGGWWLNGSAKHAIRVRLGLVEAAA
jgi:hypothetical protein